MKDQGQGIFSQRFNIALWLIGIGLLANAVVMAWPHARQGEFFANGRLAAALRVPTATAHGLYVLPARLGDKSWGLVLMDRRQKVFCVYRFLESASRLRLVAARNFRYDLRLHDYNNSAPTPGQVKSMVQRVPPTPHPSDGKPLHK